MDEVFYLRPINLSMVTWNSLLLCLWRLLLEMINRFIFQIIKASMKFCGVRLNWFDCNCNVALITSSSGWIQFERLTRWWGIKALKFGIEKFARGKFPLRTDKQDEVLSVSPRGEGCTLGISGWGCAARTLEPLAYTRASFSWILLPYTRVNSWFP